MEGFGLQKIRFGRRGGHEVVLILLSVLYLRNVFTIQLLFSASQRISSEEQTLVPPGAPKSPTIGRGDDQVCSIYLAPSSILDSNNKPAGFGIFTTKPILAGSDVLPRGSGPVVPIPDFKVNNGGIKPSFAKSIFMRHCLGMGIESDQPHTYPKYKNCYKQSPNFGILTNYHPVLLNVREADTVRYQDNLLSRDKDPGAGSFSYHMGETWHTTRHVEAGEEFFTDYGQKWFFDGVLGDQGRDIPRRENYQKASGMIQLFLDSHKEKMVGQKELGEFHRDVAAADDVDNVTKQLIGLAIPDVESFKNLVTSAKRYAAIPHNWISSKASTLLSLVRSIGLRTTSQRDIAWIRENGRCLDNIYPSPSTLPQAGQGGFATRQLMKHDVIAPMPTLVQVTDRDALNVYEHEYSNGAMKTSANAPYTKQLLINYCIGHGDSSLLLCPATNANLVNHCSTRMKEKVGQCDPNTGPNAMLQWSEDFDPDTSEWLSQDIDTLSERIKDGQRGLSLEIVALREISKDEEIFIDYGRSWEEAWEQHVATWSPPEDGKAFVPVSEMNLNVDRYLLTKVEQERGATYPHNGVRIGCYVKEFYYPCEILKKNDGPEIVYSARIRKWKSEGENYGDRTHSWSFEHDTAVGNLTSKDIKFFAGSYSSDQHLKGAFRHHIELSVGMWPKKWMNAKKPMQL